MYMLCEVDLATLVGIYGLGLMVVRRLEVGHGALEGEKSKERSSQMRHEGEKENISKRGGLT